MVIKQCKNFIGYGADEDGNVWSYYHPAGQQRLLKDTPYKMMSPFLETIKSAGSRPQRRKCLFIRLHGKKTKKFVHQIVCDAWDTRTSPEQVVLHKNDISWDCSPLNLFFGTKKVNIAMREENNRIDNKIRILQEQLNKYKELYGEIN